MAASFFDRVIDVLNTPLPGTKDKDAPEDTLLEKIKKGLEPEPETEEVAASEATASDGEEELIDFNPDFSEQDYQDDDEDEDDAEDDPEDPIAPTGRRRVQDALRAEHERELKKIRAEHEREMSKLRAEQDREAQKRAKERAKDQREQMREAQKRERETLKKQLKEARKKAKNEGRGKGGLR